MIKYNLKCKCKKTFESWFSSSSEFDNLKKKKLISCIYCNSTKVEKSLMAPNLSSKSNKNIKKNKLEKKFKNELVNLRKYIEKNCTNVGSNFPQEASKIFYDKKSSKGIYGSATPEETADLLDEGIEVSSIPWVRKVEN